MLRLKIRSKSLVVPPIGTLSPAKGIFEPTDYGILRVRQKVLSTVQPALPN
jgi:hypothetical protein